MKKLMIMVAALAMVAGFAMSVAAADWNFYGNARIETFYTSTDTIGGNDINGYVQEQPGNARVGANIKVSDELSARFEYGTGVNLRLLYGTWNFGAGALTVGQDYTPMMMAFSNQVKDGGTGLIGYGSLYAGRQAQVAVRFGNFKAAIIAPQDLSGAAGKAGDAFADATVAVPGGYADRDALLADVVAGVGGTAAMLAAYDTSIAAVSANFAKTVEFKHSIPNIQASYFHDFGGLRLRAQGGYGTSEVKNINPALGGTFDVDSYVLGFGATFKAAGFYVTGSYHMGDNVSALGVATATKNPIGLPSFATGSDAETEAYTIFAGYKVNDMFSFEAGYGKEKTEVDTSKNDASSYYVNATIAFAPGVFIVPEFGQFNTEDFDKKKTNYYGLKWQINF